jgi:hypothetical protein
MARYFFGDSEDTTTATLLFLAFLPLWRVWLFGQCSVWSLTILWGAWRLWKSDRSFMAGLVLSLGLMKPQVFIGAWAWAILWGNRRSHFGLFLGLINGVLLGMLCGGVMIWRQWIDAVLFSTTLVERIQWMTTLPQAWRLIGGEHLFGTRWILAGMAVAGVVWALSLLWMRRKDVSPEFALCFALFGGWFLMPRLYVYDSIAAWPILLAGWKYGTPRLRTFFAYCAPVFWIHDFFSLFNIPILAIAGIVAFVWFLQQTVERCRASQQA